MTTICPSINKRKHRPFKIDRFWGYNNNTLRQTNIEIGKDVKRFNTI